MNQQSFRASKLSPRNLLQMEADSMAFFSLHAKHRQRSYVFGVNPSISLDSSHVGNEARYINHSESPNCSTKGR